MTIVNGVLHDYYRSSACYRVRIALNLLGVPYKRVAVNLLNKDQLSEEFINPMHAVPYWQDGTTAISQSLAIIEYLNEKSGNTTLLPASIESRAHCRTLAQIVACDIHPLNNLRVLNYLKTVNQTSSRAQTRQQEPIDTSIWYHHWLKSGFDAFEASVKPTPFCCAEYPTLADICLIPQLYNARRFHFSLEAYPKLIAIEEECLSLDAFYKAQPEQVQ